MRMRNFLVYGVFAVLFAGNAPGKIDLATLPERDSVQITIYNSADLTLVQESRALTLKEGSNKLQFSWANTLIDPTSLEMIPLADRSKPPGLQAFMSSSRAAQREGKSPTHRRKRRSLLKR